MKQRRARGVCCAHYILISYSFLLSAKHGRTHIECTIAIHPFLIPLRCVRRTQSHLILYRERIVQPIETGLFQTVGFIYTCTKPSLNLHRNHAAKQK
ncbi:hypothetical protein DFH11DRAFT_1841322 [Phellopilus nigrolimitatus]|nr:hypothetical protein DFH11DRAFT_1841322 [Phellopilus nigrolimitatus]